MPLGTKHVDQSHDFPTSWANWGADFFPVTLHNHACGLGARGVRGLAERTQPRLGSRILPSIHTSVATRNRDNAGGERTLGVPRGEAVRTDCEVMVSEPGVLRTVNTTRSEADQAAPKAAWPTRRWQRPSKQSALLHHFEAHHPVWHCLCFPGLRLAFFCVTPVTGINMVALL